MESFFRLLENRVDQCGSLLCVGLDPHVSDLTAPTAEAALEFSIRLITETAPYAAAFKPNVAFFEQFGAQGWIVLEQVIQAIAQESKRLGSEIPVVLDAKRGDISTTADAYARSAFDHLKAHSITLSPYLGRDSVEPFIGNPQNGVFLLCKTSNPGSADLQDLSLTANEPLYLHVARLANQWNVRDNIGLVIGATQPEALRKVRQAVPTLWFLCPGIGAQGGDLETALNAGLRADRKGMLIPVSRGISRAQSPAQAAKEIGEAIRRVTSGR